MQTRPRTQLGQFAPKSNQPRKVRSIRLTDATWDKLANLALAHDECVTRADLLENWMEEDQVIQGGGVNPQALAILQEALTLKANAGGKIKAKIREALQMMQ